MHLVRDVAPAERWEDAFLSGNGEYGIMVYGGPATERVIVNHHRFVLPNGTRDLRPPHLADRLARTRKLILAGRRVEAARLFTGDRRLFWTQPFHPGFAMTIDRPPEMSAAGYERTTDFTTGEVSVSWDGRPRHRAFVSRADGVVVQQINGGPAVVGLTGDLPGRPDDVGYAVSAYEKAGLIFLAVRGTYPAGLGAFGFEGVTLVLGDATVAGDRVTVHGDALLLTRLARHEKPGWQTARLETELAALAGRTYTELLLEHVARHAPAYLRATLDLGVPGEERALPVGELLAAPDPPALLELLFHSGRYLLLSSSGALPPRLTGLWLGEWAAPWLGGFAAAHLDLQMAGANIGALPEVTAAYRRLIRDQIEDWRTNAREIYAARGVLAPGRTDGEHGRLVHFDARWPWTAWLPGADCLLLPLVEEHLVTGEGLDELRPWLAAAAEFFEDVLTVKRRGRVVVVPSFSAETGPDGECLGVNATMDVAAARHALTTAAEVTGSHRWDDLLARLPGYLVDDRGALAERAWPGYIADDDYPHARHLYPVWPLHEITPDGTPELAAAARRALELPGDEYVPVERCLRQALVATRLRDGALAYANLRRVIGDDMFFRSLMSSAVPGRRNYNADAAHTLPGLLIEMLVGSRPGLVDLLPALPAELSHGRLRGALCRGRVSVEDLAWEPGAVRATLRSAVAQEVLLRTPIGERRVKLPAGETVRVGFRR